MRIIFRFLIALALLGTTANTFLHPAFAAQTRATPDGAFGLQVSAVRPLPDSGGMELVFKERSAAALREFSQRAAAMWTS